MKKVLEFLHCILTWPLTLYVFPAIAFFILFCRISMVNMQSWEAKYYFGRNLMRSMMALHVFVVSLSVLSFLCWLLVSVVGVVIYWDNFELSKSSFYRLIFSFAFFFIDNFFVAGFY